MGSAIFHALNIPRTYRWDSLPLYLLDWLGFHSTELRPFLPRGLIVYRLWSGTSFLARPFTHDRVVIDEIFIHRVYTPKGLLDVACSDRVIVDLGAHIGVFTIYAATKALDCPWQGDVRVYSYEPDPENYAILRANVAMNSLEKYVRGFRKAVADRNGTLSLYIDSENHLSSLKFQGPNSLDVEAVTLDRVFEEEGLDGIDFLKFDVEGSELDVFRGVSSDHIVRVRKIAGECHSLESTSFIAWFLKKHGFCVRVTPGTEPTLFYLYAKKC